MILVRVLQASFVLLLLSGCGGGGGSGGEDIGVPAVTADATPDSFTFVDVGNAPKDTLITSEPVTITGINTSAEIAIEGGKYSVNGGAFQGTSGSVSNSDEVRVQLRSSSTLGGTVSASLTVGGVADTFDVQTREDETPPTASIVFPAVPDTWVYQRELVIRGTAADNKAIESVYVNDLLASTTDSFANWQLQVSVAEPHSEFVVRVVDIDGNETALEPIRVNAHAGYAVRAFGALALDIDGGRLFAGPRPTKIEFSDLKFQPYENSDLIVTEMVFDAARDKWYGATDDYIAEFSPESGAVLAQYSVSSQYTTSMDVDEASGKIYWNNMDSIQVLDPAANTSEYVSGPTRGTGQDLEPDAKVVINNRTLYAITVTFGATNFEAHLMTIDPATGNRTLHTNLYETSEKITEVMAVDSHPTESLLYFLAKSELGEGGAEDLFTFNLDTGEIQKIFQMADADSISADFVFSRLQLDHVNNTVYVLTQSSDHLYKIDLTTGDIAQLSSGFRGTGPVISGDRVDLPLVFDTTSNRLLTASSSSWSDSGGKLLAIDPNTGTRQIVSGPSRGAGVSFAQLRNFAATGSGAIFAVDYRDAAIKRVATESGDRSVVADASRGCCTSIDAPADIAIDQQGLTAIVLDQWGRLLEVDLVTGNRQVLSDSSGSFGSGPVWNGLRRIAADFEQGVVYAFGWPESGKVALYEVSLTTGDRTLLVSGDRGVALPDANNMFYDAERGRMLFPTRDESTSYFEYDLNTGVLTEKPYLGADGSTGVFRISNFAKAGNRLFAILHNPNHIVEIDEMTGSMVIISQ